MFYINWNLRKLLNNFYQTNNPKKFNDQCSALNNSYACKIKLIANQRKH